MDRSGRGPDLPDRDKASPSGRKALCATTRKCGPTAAVGRAGSPDQREGREDRPAYLPQIQGGGFAAGLVAAAGPTTRELG